MSWMTLVPWISTASISYWALTYQTSINGFGFSSWAVFFLVSVFSMGLAVTPTTFISIFCGHFLGWYSFVPVVLSYQLASLVGYHLAHKLDYQTIDLLKSKYPKSTIIFDNVMKREWATTFLARVSPALPFGLMNVVLSVSGVRWVPFFFGGLIGMLPRTILFIWLGSQSGALVEALRNNDYEVWFIIITFVGLVALYKLLTARR